MRGWFFVEVIFMINIPCVCRGDSYRMLMGKSGQEKENLWLPLWMHLRDTAGVMEQLVTRWIPESVFLATGLDREWFLKTAVFLAAVHDIGKATSYFQSVITKSCPEKYDEIVGHGFVVNKSDRGSGKTPHARAGQCILQNNTHGLGVQEDLAVVVGAHHGEPYGRDHIMKVDLITLHPDNFFGAGKNDEARRVWKDAWDCILDQAIRLAGVRTVDELPVLTPEAQVLLSGLLITADWIASNTTYFPLLPLDDYGDDAMYPERIRKGWERIDFPDGWSSETDVMDDGTFEKRFGFYPNDVQKCVLDVVNRCDNPGIFILEAQMGVGKTEAALGTAEVLAHRKQEGGIFFGLPTQATSNGLFGRLYEWGRQVSEETVNAIRLAHGSAELNEDYRSLSMKGRAYIGDDGEQDTLGVHPWFQGNKRALLADFVIGTVDQFLMASLRRKHFMLRHVGLAGKVVVIDECHAYDAYMNEYLERSIQWMAVYGVPVILLSATLPSSRRKALIDSYVKTYSRYCLGKRKPEITYKRPDWKETTDYPLLTWTDGESVNQKSILQSVPEKTVKISRVNSIRETVGLLDERLRDGGCACIIANTVKRAQEVYTECEESMQGAEPILYHAQFTMPDREIKEKYLLKKMGKHSGADDRNRVILIGTQVLEQSLDYDADIMVTQLCPVDLLLQRIGRLHRHDGRIRPAGLENPECLILGDGDDAYDRGSRAVYGDYLLMRTEKILTDEITIPGDIPLMVQKVYDSGQDLGLNGELYESALAKYEDGLKTKKCNARDYLLRSPSKKEIENILDNPETSSEKTAEASVRDGASSIEVLLMKKGADEDILFVSKTFEKTPALSSTRTPTSAEGRMVAMQRLRLPYVFSCSEVREKTIEELRDKNRRELPEWAQSPWIHGELVLLLDENNQTELNGFRLSYSFEKGLEYERERI